MSSHYDAIFKYILTDRRSSLVATLTTLKRGKALSNDAGWYTGRSVDYISKLSATLYIHIEVQTRIDSTMHWRMVNYFTLLHHKLHGWRDDKVTILQFLVYLGEKKNTMQRLHSKFGEPYNFKVLDIYRCNLPSLAKSGFYGDRIVSLLTAGIDRNHWRKVFGDVCSLRNEAERMEGMFYLLHLSALRGQRQMIEDAINEMGMYEALLSTPLTQRAAEDAAVGAIVELLSEFYTDVEEPALSEEERDILLGLKLPKVKIVYKAITRSGHPRAAIVAAAMLEQVATNLKM